VFDLLGSVRDFETAASTLGFDWLRSQKSDEDDNEADDDPDDDVGVSGCLYLTMPSLDGLRRLMAQWTRYTSGRKADPGFEALWKIFPYLKELRTWSAKDRIDPGLAAYIQRLLSDGNREVLVELDLWYVSSPAQRDRSAATLQKMVEQVNGQLLDLVDIHEIQYLGALVRLPAAVAKRLADAEGELALLDEVMTIRPQSSWSSHVLPAAPELREIPPFESNTKSCLVALLDGYPVEAHDALAERIIVREVDVRGEHAPVSSRRHGTAMASLVAHGDLQANHAPHPRPIAVVPVLTADPNTGREVTPPGLLPIGVIYRALQAIVKDSADEKSAMATVSIVNHSVCDTFAPFIRRPSPWAALLDYFSHHHRLLFVLSAGNIFDSFRVDLFQDRNELEGAEPLERQAAIMNAIERAKAGRGIFSPAESINNLTVGALHADDSQAAESPDLDPYPNLVMTNLASALGFGVNRCLKPDLVEQGGRFAIGCANVPGGGIDIHAKRSTHFGHLVAAPSPTGELRSVDRIAGTSNAAALVSRSCARVADALEDVFSSTKENLHDRSTRVPMLKALATHGCSWGRIGEVLEDAYPPHGARKWHGRRDTIAKFLGYGQPAVERVVTGGDNRVTLLADDEILPEELHEYRIPIPRAMLHTRDIRSVTITLAWTTPIVTTSMDYRGVSLAFVDADGKTQYWKGYDRKLQPNGTTAQRGTLLHLSLEGKRLQRSVDEKGLFIGVQAMARHFSQTMTKVPYALAVTLEMAQSQNTGIYADVSEAIRLRDRARVQPRASQRI